MFVKGVCFLSVFKNSPQSLNSRRKLLRDKQNKKTQGSAPVFSRRVYERPTLLGDFLTASSAKADVGCAHRVGDAQL